MSTVNSDADVVYEGEFQRQMELLARGHEADIDCMKDGCHYHHRKGQVNKPVIRSTKAMSNSELLRTMMGG